MTSYVTPIIFSTDMVLALSAGRKTQTRRLITSQWANLKMHHDLGEECWMYVRERWAPDFDGCPLWFASKYGSKPFSPEDEPVKWKPSIHMPRTASRLSLKVTEVRKQRLLVCSDGDALADGGWEWGKCPVHKNPRRSYMNLWDSLHTKPGNMSADNPDVIAITFEVHRGNIDTFVKEAA